MHKSVRTAFLVIVAVFFLSASMIPAYSDQPKRDSVNLSTLASLTSVDPHPGAENVQDNIVYAQVYEGLVAQNQGTGEYEMRIGQVRAEARRSTSPKTFKLNVQLR